MKYFCLVLLVFLLSAPGYGYFTQKHTVTQFSQWERATQVSVETQQYYHQKEQVYDLGVWLKLNEAFDLGSNAGFVVKAQTYFIKDRSLETYQIPELYFSYGKKLQLSLGRKLGSWSQQSKWFYEGSWNSQWTWEAMWPELQGDTGLHLNYVGSGFKMAVSAALISLPSQGAELKFKNGKISTKNPFFPSPPESVTYDSNTFDVNYEQGAYSLSDVLVQPGILVSFENQGSEDWAWKLSYAYKSIAPVFYNVDFTTQFVDGEFPIDVKITPYRLSHHLATGELGYNFSSKTSLLASFSYESPQDLKKTDPYLTSQSLSSRQNYALMMQTQGKWGRAKLGYSKTYGGDVVTSGELEGALARQNSYILFKSAWLLDWQFPSVSGWDMSTKFIYDSVQSGIIGQVQLQKLWSKRFLSYVKVDFIEPLTNEYRPGFIYDSRSLDRFSVGLSYIL